MARRPRPPSTELSLALERRKVVAFDDEATNLTRIFAKPLGVEPKVESVRHALADPARIDARLRELPAPALAALEHLVEMGGEVGRRSLAEMVAGRLGLEPESTHRAVDMLVGAALVVPLARYGNIESVALLDLSAAAIAERVHGLTLPEVKEPPALDAVPDVALRDRVALVASVAHVPVRFTMGGDTNRSSAKKLAAIVGRDAAEVAAQLDAAIRGGVLGTKDKQLWPIVERLRALARDEVIADELDADARRVAEWVGPRWVSREAVVRAVVAAEMRLREGYDAFFGGGTEDFAVAERLVSRAPLLRASASGVELVRAPERRAPSGHGDGHVTPSFDVMLGPLADPELCVTLALATEPGRHDLVLTRRITPKAVRAAVELGLRAEEILDALAKVGRHGVPDNVHAMVRDWAGAAQSVRITKVWAVEAPSPDAADTAARTLGARVASRPSPTLLLVSGEADPTRALVASGLGIDAPCTPLSRSKTKPSPLPVSPPLSLVPEPDPALRARLVAEQGRGAPEPEPETFVPWAALAALADTLRDDDAERVLEFTDTFASLWQAAGPAFAQWASHSATVPEVLRLTTERPLEALPWLLLSPRDRRAALASAAALDEVIAAAKRITRPPTTTDGMRAEQLLRDPRLRQLLAPLGLEDGETAAMSASQIRERFTEAATIGAVVTLRVRGPGGERSLSLIPERIHERGRDVALLGVDPETEKSLSFPLAQVIALAPL